MLSVWRTHTRSALTRSVGEDKAHAYLKTKSPKLYKVSGPKAQSHGSSAHAVGLTDTLNFVDTEWPSTHSDLVFPTSRRPGRKRRQRMGMCVPQQGAGMVLDVKPRTWEQLHEMHGSSRWFPSS